LHFHPDGRHYTSTAFPLSEARKPVAMLHWVHAILNLLRTEPIRIDDGDGVWPAKDYTGPWACHWPNGQVKYRATYINGKRHGRVICYWEDGTIAQEGTCEADECRGVWTDYRFGGKYKETDYIDGNNFTVTFFNPADGRVVSRQVWKDGRQIEPNLFSN
jgi:hypothetical protein